MFVAGIDVSTKAIDLVLIPLDDGPPEWHHYPLAGADAWERTRSIAYAMPGPRHSMWDDVVAIGVENPAGTHGAHAIQRAVGAVLACLPPLTLVQPWRPSEWRRASGLKGNATKDQVAFFAVNHGDDFRDWPQDACDAYCIALATRHTIELKAAAA